MAQGIRAPATLVKADWLAGLASALDSRPIGEIRAPDILALLKPLEAAGQLETARCLHAFVSRVFRYAAAQGLVESDPSTLLRGAIASPKVTPRAAIVDRDGFAKLMRAIAAYEGRGGLVRDALMLLALTAARPGELRLARWEGEFDLAAGVWTLPAERMKMRQPRRSRAARAPGGRDSRKAERRGWPGATVVAFRLSVATARPALIRKRLHVALRAMGYAKGEATAHGFRSSFSTLANESGLWAFDAVERALAHQDQSDVRRAYHRADYFKERKRLMQWWADEIERML